MSVNSFYYSRASLGELPEVGVYQTNDGQFTPIEVVDRLSVSDQVANMVGLVYPERQTISFNSYSELELGDRVTVYMYYNGQSYNGVIPYGLIATHPGSVFSGRVKEKSTKLPDKDEDKIYSYKVDKDFRELGDKISVSIGDTIQDVINKLPHVVSFKSDVEGALGYTIHTAQSEIPLDEVLSQLSLYATYDLGGYCYCSIDEGVLTLHRVTEEGTFDVVTRSNTTSPIIEKESANKTIKSVYWGKVDNFDKQDVSDSEVWEYRPNDYEGIYWKNGQEYPSTGSPSWPVSKSGDVVSFVPYVNLGKRKWETRNEAGDRYYEYYEKDIGEVKSVRNVWVPEGHLREGYLDWQLGQTEQSGKYDMLTNLFFIPLGSVVAVETEEEGKGWKGILLGKDINVAMTKSSYSFTYNIKIQKITGTVDYCFNWGDQWDTGKEFCE